MASTETLLAFFLATLAFAVIPGPAILYATARTLAQGRRAGLGAAFGISIGGFAHVAAAAAGLSVLVHAVPTLFLAVKLFGAAYLIWLGIGMWRSRDKGQMPVGLPRLSPLRALRQSILVEALNPKTALFFLAFLPQFADPAGSVPVWLQLVILGTIVNLTFGMMDVVAVLFASAIAGRLARSGRWSRLVQRAGGGLLVGLGLHMATQRA
jgi:threonine/homoserine/homoserine lactone efflux protein